MVVAYLIFFIDVTNVVEMHNYGSIVGYNFLHVYERTYIHMTNYHYYSVAFFWPFQVLELQLARSFIIVYVGNLKWDNIFFSNFFWILGLFVHIWMHYLRWTWQ